MSFDGIVFFGEDLGWLSNIIAVLGTFAAVLSFFKKIIFIKIRKYFFCVNYKNIRQFICDRRINSKVDEKSIKIMIIDDHREDFPIDYINRRGLNLSYRSSVSLLDLDDLLKYSLILLDMKGVVTEDLDFGAFELLKRLKENEVPSYVVAVSKSKFDPKSSDYFRLADDVKSKPIDQIEFDHIWDDFIKNEFSVEENAKKIDHILDANNISRKMSKKATSLIVQYIESGDEIFLTRLMNLPAGFDKNLIVSCARKIWRSTK